MSVTTRRRATIVGLALLLPAVVVTTALAVPVTGTLQFPRNYKAPQPAAPEGPSPFYWEEWNGFLEQRASSFDPRRELAAVLLGESGGEAPESVMRLVGGDFSPSVVVVRGDTTLRIDNTDGCAHELFAEGLLEPLQTAAGRARTQPLPDSGKWEIRDRLYGHVHGFLHIMPNLVARAEVQPDGRYNFGDVPAGTYTVKVFFRDGEVGSKEVVVTDGRGFTIDALALNLPAPE